MNARNIASGMINLATGENAALAERRMQHCRTCRELFGVFCQKCGCYVLAKTRVPDEKCPMNKW